MKRSLERIFHKGEKIKNKKGEVIHPKKIGVPQVIGVFIPNKKYTKKEEEILEKEIYKNIKKRHLALTRTNKSIDYSEANSYLIGDSKAISIREAQNLIGDWGLVPFDFYKKIN